jgi:hypothetical protein
LSRLVGRRRWPEVFPVTPATILRWHRDFVVRKWDYTKLFHDFEVAVHLGRLVQVERAGQLLDVDDVGEVGLGEPQDGERAAHGRVRARAERQDPQRRGRVVCHLGTGRTLPDQRPGVGFGLRPRRPAGETEHAQPLISDAAEAESPVRFNYNAHLARAPPWRRSAARAAT